MAAVPRRPDDDPSGIDIAVLDKAAGIGAGKNPEMFAKGWKAGRWLKTGRLDLEAKGMIAHAAKGPVRLFRTGRQVD